MNIAHHIALMITRPAAQCILNISRHVPLLGTGILLIVTVSYCALNSLYPHHDSRLFLTMKKRTILLLQVISLLISLVGKYSIHHHTR